MTRKDFEAIAAAVALVAADAAGMSQDFSAGHAAALSGVAVRIADHCAQTNPNFDRARFLRACGVV